MGDIEEKISQTPEKITLYEATLWIAFNMYFSASFNEDAIEWRRTRRTLRIISAEILMIGRLCHVTKHVYRFYE